jgi:hypothetical protein
MTTDETIVVVGGGVSGLTTGVVLLEAGLSVRLIAKEVPARTSRGAGAIWSPSFVEPWADVREWSLTLLSGHRVTVPLVDMAVYLDRLCRRFRDLGGAVEQRVVRSLDEFADVSAVVNCAGMGAAEPAETPRCGQRLYHYWRLRSRGSRSSSPSPQDRRPASSTSIRTGTQSFWAVPRSMPGSSSIEWTSDRRASRCESSPTVVKTASP